MRLEDLKPAKGSVRKRKLKGRGWGSGHGKTSCRGNNGQGQRSGSQVRPGFEGGQMPLFRRTPKKKYFHVVNRVNYGVVNVSALSRYEAKSTVNITTLVNDGLIDKHSEALRILGVGELNVALTVEAEHFSEAAKQKIEAAGGKAVVLGSDEE